MQRIGIVDLGSNTARLVVYAYEPGRWFRLDDEIRELVRLGEGMGTGRRLSPAAVERAAVALKLYADYARTVGLDRLEVLATSALRDAENGGELLDRIRPLGLDLRILSGQDEAALGVSAVANGFILDDAWVVDVGGGSAQLSRMRGREFADGRAYPLGTVRLTEAHLRTDPPRGGEVKALERTVEDHLGEAADAMARDPAPLVAMGGTIRNLARLVVKTSAYPLARLHGYFLRREDLERTVNRLLGLPLARRLRLPGIHPDRADVLLAGALLYRWLLRRTGQEGVWISGYGLREGAFFRHFLPPPHRIEHLRGFSVRNLFERFPQPTFHVEQVRRLARRLFEELAPIHGLGDDEKELLDDAARLHDIGMAVGYYNHHKHGSYLIERTHLLHGFSHREQALLMLLVRYHRKGTPRWGLLRALARPGDKKLLLRLAVCLRLAEYLERSHSGNVDDVHARIGDQDVVLGIETGEDSAIELWETRKQAPLFELAFGRRLVLEPTRRGRAGVSPAAS